MVNFIPPLTVNEYLPTEFETKKPELHGTELKSSARSKRATVPTFARRRCLKAFDVQTATVSCKA
jgi:hypothetical protein